MLLNLVAEPGRPPSGDAEERETGLLLADALDGLEPDSREVMVFRNLRELDWNDVARRMCRTPGAARTVWTRAIRGSGEVLKEQWQ